MPYSGPDDNKLPPNVKAMPTAKRSKWVRIWNAAFKNCRSPKIGAAGSVKKCEAAAFKFANGAVKEMTMDDLTEAEKQALTERQREEQMTARGGRSLVEVWHESKGHEGEFAVCQDCMAVASPALKRHECTGEKCSECMAVEPYRALGGATSFAEADNYEEANQLENHIREQEYLFRRINDNIFASDTSLAEKLAKVKAAATELEGRLEKPPEQKGLVDRLKGALGIGEKVDPADKPVAAKESSPGAFTAFKDALGNWRWMTITSNIWRDRDGEIIPGDAHEGAVSYAERTKDMPDLRLWHVPGSRIGVADWVDFAHGFVLHSGSFDKGMEGAAESLAASKETLGVSHGFYHGKDPGDDTYPWYRDFEVSVLPLEKAANQWTEFNAENVKEVIMGLSDERRGFLVKHIGEGQVTALEKLLEEKEADLKSGKVDFKEVLAEAIEATPEGDPQPAEGDAGGEPDGVAAQIARLAEAVEAQGKQITEIATGQGDQATAIKALQRTDDEKIAAKMAPERKPPADGERPSESEGTEITAEAAANKGADPDDAIDPADLPDSPGGKALKQLTGAGG